MAMTLEAFSREASRLATLAETLPLYGEERALVLDLMGDLWRNHVSEVSSVSQDVANGMAAIWYDAATYCRSLLSGSN